MEETLGGDAENHPSPDNSTEDALVSLLFRFLYSVLDFETEISRRTTRFFSTKQTYTRTLCFSSFEATLRISCISLASTNAVSSNPSKPRDFLDRLKRFLNRDKDRDLITRARVIILRAYKDS